MLDELPFSEVIIVLKNILEEFSLDETRKEPSFPSKKEFFFWVLLLEAGPYKNQLIDGMKISFCFDYSRQISDSEIRASFNLDVMIVIMVEMIKRIPVAARRPAKILFLLSVCSVTLSLNPSIYSSVAPSKIVTRLVQIISRFLG